MSLIDEKLSLYLPVEEQLYDMKIPSQISNFAELFNVNPNETINNLRKLDEIYCDPYYLAKILCITKGISIYRRSDILFNPLFQPQPLLFFFFSALNTEFTTILDSATIFFSLFAFPNNASLLKIIFGAFADAYLSKNANCVLLKNDVVAISVALIGFCASSSSTTMVSPEIFKLYFNRSSLPEENIFGLYTAITTRPVDVKFTFGQYYELPTLSKSALISCKKTIFKRNKVTCLRTNGYWLEVYSDAKYQNLRNSFLLYDVTAEVTKSGDDFNLEISSNNNNSKLIIGPNKFYEDSKLVINGDQYEQLKEWIEVINYISFLCCLHNLVNDSVQRGEVKKEFLF